MGLSYETITQLLDAYQKGASFDATLTTGRQNLYLHRQEIAELGFRPELCRPFGVYADELLREVLNVTKLTTIDASSYEGAGHVHDLNEPVPRDLELLFDAAIDGGSLEHIFNFPVALANLMRMTKVGGRVFLSNPANNLCGHGFYQFSPELMYRVFRPERGFVIERVTMVDGVFPSVELVRRRAVWDIVDPAEIGRRVLRVSRRPSVLVVTARKIAHLSEPFTVFPQQSDYSIRWAVGDKRLRRGEERFDRIPAGIRSRLIGYVERFRASPWNRQAYRRAD
jgi:hypothetical protein